LVFLTNSWIAYAHNHCYNQFWKAAQTGDTQAVTVARINFFSYHASLCERKSGFVMKKILIRAAIRAGPFFVVYSVVSLLIRRWTYPDFLPRPEIREVLLYLAVGAGTSFLFFILIELLKEWYYSRRTKQEGRKKH
jgi:hypothetical protein